MKITANERLIAKLHKLFVEKRLLDKDIATTKSLLRSYLSFNDLTKEQWKYIKTICWRSKNEL